MVSQICYFNASLSGVDTDAVSVMEGDSVTLHTGVQTNQQQDIKWYFKDTRIAQINGNLNKSCTDVQCKDGDERFRDRLKLDNQTGSLTITNTRTSDSGEYKLYISSNNIEKIFSVAVHARLPVPVISRNCSSSSSSSNCSVVCSSSVLSVCDATLSWYAGMSVLSSISVCDLSISLSLPLEVEYQDKNTYSCVLNNPISNQTTHLDINTLCNHTCADTHTPSQQDSSLIVLISAGSLFMVAIVVGIFCICRKCKNLSIQTRDEEIMYAETTFYKGNRHTPKVEEDGHVVYAGVTVR
ncbi:hypothetical protein F2P79_013862 [Pimephales promelas]|nr:hypothetical protein F2P79_013862 [Pimephales promelas]